MTAWRNKRFVPYLYMLPIVAFCGLFLYYALGFTIFTSFHRWNGISPKMKYVGWSNYENLFSDHVFFLALKNVAVFFAATVLVQALLGFLIAVFFREPFRGKSFYRAVFFIPVIMSPAVIAAIFRIILDPNVGQLNVMLRHIGLAALAKPWLGDPHIALYSIIAVNIFEWMGF